jgi:hypothetical protein
VALEVPGRLRPRIFSTFGSTRVVGRQTRAPAALTPGEIPSTHFQRLSQSQGTWFCRKEPQKKSQVTPPRIDPGTVRLVAQRLNHYATSCDNWNWEIIDLPIPYFSGMQHNKMAVVSHLLFLTGLQTLRAKPSEPEYYISYADRTQYFFLYQLLAI